MKKTINVKKVVFESEELQFLMSGEESGASQWTFTGRLFPNGTVLVFNDSCNDEFFASLDEAVAAYTEPHKTTVATLGEECVSYSLSAIGEMIRASRREYGGRSVPPSAYALIGARKAA